MTKIFKHLEKIVKISTKMRVYVFSTKNLALKWSLKNMSCKRPWSTFTNLDFRLVQQKQSKNDKKREKLQHFGIDLLTLNYGLPSSFTALSSWRTTKRGQGPLMKIDAPWVLPVYPVLKAQSHEKKVWKHLTKTKKIDRAPIQSNSWIVKNTAPQYNSNSLNCKKIGAL